MAAAYQNRIVGYGFEAPDQLLANPAEEWRDVPNWDGRYQASSEGRVRRRGNGRGSQHNRILTPVLINSGYVTVGLSRDQRSTRCLIHRLVAEAFVGPIPAGHEVNHIDGNKLNNCLSNLEVVTRSENMLHASRTGLAYRGVLNGQSKLTAQQVAEIRSRYCRGGNPGYKALAKEYGVSWEAVRNIIKGRSWSYD